MGATMSDTSRGVALDTGNKDIDFPDDSPRGVSLGYNEGPSEWANEYSVLYPNGLVTRRVSCKPQFHEGSVTQGASGSGISATDEWRCDVCSGGARAHKEFVMGCLHEDVKESDIVECIKPADCFGTKDENGTVCVYIPPGMEDPGVWLVCWSEGFNCTVDEYDCVWTCRREEAEDPCDEGFMREIST